MKAEEFHTSRMLPKGENWTDRDAFLFAEAYLQYRVNAISDEEMKLGYEKEAGDYEDGWDEGYKEGWNDYKQLLKQ